MAKAKPAQKRTLKEAGKANLVLLGIMLAVMWGLEIIDALILDQGLNGYGIRPRSSEGLLGILFAPVLHGDFPHLISNSVPFALLGFFVLLRGLDTFVKVTLATVIVGGLAVWLVGASQSVHIGASGVVFGFFGYLLAIGFLDRSIKSILIAVVVGFLYGGIIFGVLPGKPGVSWEGHLFGFMAGAGIAWLEVQRKNKRGAKNEA